MLQLLQVPSTHKAGFKPYNLGRTHKIHLSDYMTIASPPPFPTIFAQYAILNNEWLNLYLRMIEVIESVIPMSALWTAPSLPPWPLG